MKNARPPSFQTQEIITSDVLGQESNSLTVQEVRQILGSTYRCLSDQEINQIRITTEILARIALECFKHASKNCLKGEGI